jgi:GH15 family glucan-1,4-alpha-glucosidase
MIGRIGGFAPIEDYAVIGDGRTAALIARDGRIDWWPIPTLDSPPACAAILDPDKGGHFRLAPEDAFDAERSYVEGTNVLETVYTTATGSVRVTESLNVGAAGRLPWTELARRVDGLSGEVALCWELVPGNRFGQARPWVSDRRDSPIVHLGDQTMSVILDGAEPAKVGTHAVTGRLLCRGTSCHLVAVVATDDEPLFLPSPEAVYARMERTIDAWRAWSELVAHDGPWKAAVVRSALALKTVLYEPGGAIAAAATTSLPEVIGGSKNYDYRYSWVRDSSFALDALINLELHEEVHSSVSWLLAALRRTAPDLHVFYALDGRVADSQAELDAPGYRDSRPVRVGNAASNQRQLGVYGDLFDTVYRYVDEGHVLDAHTAATLGELADRCCDSWTEQDSGMWELPDLQHYTISKIGCWVALDRAARLADIGQLPDAKAERWRAEAADVKAWVEEHCWSDAERSYTFYAGTDRLDAAVLLAGRTGFDRGERLVRTIDAVIANLARGPMVYRYSGMEAEEGAFVACSFWLVNALVHVGRIDDARVLMDQAVGMVNDVGLLSEEIDPTTGGFLGNMPQGLSHLALINASHTLGAAG